jgi:hypothetical protein
LRTCFTSIAVVSDVTCSPGDVLELPRNLRQFKPLLKGTHLNSNLLASGSVLPHVVLLCHQENHCTPRIDAVLHQYRQRGAQDKEVWSRSHAHGVYTEREMRPLLPMNELSYESRLIQLEGQLTDLLTRSRIQKVSCGWHPLHT